MREIIFRGLDATGQKGWVYGDLVHNKKVTRTGLEDRVMVGGYEVVPESVGQYTGLRDKDRREIYEGDVVKRSSVHSDISKTYYCGVVFFDGSNASFRLRMFEQFFCGRNIGLDEDVDDIECNFVTKVVYEGQTPQEDEYCYEVIGNIYENSDLLDK